MELLADVLEQAGLASAFYLIVVGLFRVAGKRFAGQTTTFDLIILISLAVATQNFTLRNGNLNSMIFLVTTFSLHLVLAALCRKSDFVRDLVRGAPSQLIENGEVLHANLRSERLTMDELTAGLRKLGIDDVSKVECAFLEETGQISATEIEEPAGSESSKRTRSKLDTPDLIQS